MNTKRASVAAVRRMFPPGAEFLAQYPHDPTMRERRVVVSNSSSVMQSKRISGPHAGSTVRCDWKGVTAVEGPGFVTLSDPESGEFLRLWQVLESRQ